MGKKDKEKKEEWEYELDKERYDLTTYTYTLIVKLIKKLLAQEKAKMIKLIQKRLPKKNKIVPEWETERSVYISKSKNATIDEVIKLLKEYEYK